MNPQLPPLPEPYWLPHPPGDPYTKNGAMGFSGLDMHAYGLQCAEAERARCWEEVSSMANRLREAKHPVSNQEHRDYAATLLQFVADQIKPQDAP